MGAGLWLVERCPCTATCGSLFLHPCSGCTAAVCRLSCCCCGVCVYVWRPCAGWLLVRCCRWAWLAEYGVLRHRCLGMGRICGVCAALGTPRGWLMGASRVQHKPVGVGRCVCVWCEEGLFIIFCTAPSCRSGWLAGPLMDRCVSGGVGQIFVGVAVHTLRVQAGWVLAALQLPGLTWPPSWSGSLGISRVAAHSCFRPLRC